MFSFFVIMSIVIIISRASSPAPFRRGPLGGFGKGYEEILNPDEEFSGAADFNYGHYNQIVNQQEQDVGYTLIFGVGALFALYFVVVGQVFWAIISIFGAICAFVAYGKALVKSNRKRRREEALASAKMFLSPYRDIWRNLILSNKFCSLKLGKDGKTIIGAEKKADPNQPYRTFKIVKSNVFDWFELWNMFCTHFVFNNRYESLLELCNVLNVKIVESIMTPRPATKNSMPALLAKTDVNNSSEAELTALPGINIVISKKIIKKREDIGGFKDIESFLKFVNLKPNVTEQLREKICINEMKGVIKVQRNNERTIDL